MVALVFLGLHVLTAVIDTYVHVGVLAAVLPFTSSFKTFWTGLGTVAVDLLLAVAVSSALRQRIAPRTWRGLHWLAYACWPLAMAHALGTGTDAGQLWMDAIAAACSTAVLVALVWRLAYHRTTRGAEERLGASTRAVPIRHRPRTAAATSARTPATAASNPAPTATRLLERDPR
jgi:sulfoxide reductase heme-binding subunit YedZ